ncbi:MAG TPA: radical SAM protein [Clostridia bacterium]
MATSWTQLNDKLLRLAHERHIPLVGQFELTSRCNLRCGMCYVCNTTNDKKVMEKEFSADKWLSLAREARDAGMLHLMLTGGEILMHPQFREIYEGVTEMGLRITLNTNATMITEEIAEFIGSRPPSRVSVTIYGASYETYKNICGSGEAFEKALKGIDLLLENKVPVAMRTTVVKGNKDEFDQLAEFARSRGVEFGVVNYVVPRREGCGTDPVSLRLTPSELAEYEEYVFIEYNRRLSSERGEKSTESIINPDDKIEKVSQDEGAFQCEAGKTAFWITWDGRMLPCGLIDCPVVYPFESGFPAAWREMKRMCADIPVCSKCSNCDDKKYCMSCPARLKAETGFFDKPGDYLCNLAKQRKLLDSKRESLNTFIDI